MAAALVVGSPVARLVLLCSSHADGRRRHQRRRNWDSGTSGKKKDEETRVSITVEHVGRGARAALERVAKVGSSLVEEWRAGLVSVTGAAGLLPDRPATSADLMGLAVFGVVLVAVAVKVLGSLVARYSRWGQRVVVRRDRSLGGREVVVGTMTSHQSANKMPRPLIPLGELPTSNVQQQQQQQRRRHKEETLPGWWSPPPPPSTAAVDSYAQTEANELVRVIVNKRVSAIDFEEEDVVQLRQICRHSGASVDFGTENTRDSFFRAAVGFILSACCRLNCCASHVEYCGESMVSFVCGLATNIHMDASRAASIVSAAVAARTRAGFLQSWANVAQGKLSEGMCDIGRLVSMHLVFPPGPNSPHMEMVGRGLEAHLAPQERLQLLQMYGSFAQSTEAALEALSLPP